MKKIQKNVLFHVCVPQQLFFPVSYDTCSYAQFIREISPSNNSLSVSRNRPVIFLMVTYHPLCRKKFWLPGKKNAQKNRIKFFPPVPPRLSWKKINKYLKKIILKTHKKIFKKLHFPSVWCSLCIQTYFKNCIKKNHAITQDQKKNNSSSVKMSYSCIPQNNKKKTRIVISK